MFVRDEDFEFEIEEKTSFCFSIRQSVTFIRSTCNVLSLVAKSLLLVGVVCLAFVLIFGFTELPLPRHLHVVTVSDEPPAPPVINTYSESVFPARISLSELNSNSPLHINDYASTELDLPAQPRSPTNLVYLSPEEAARVDALWERQLEAVRRRQQPKARPKTPAEPNSVSVSKSDSSASSPSRHARIPPALTAIPAAAAARAPVFSHPSSAPASAFEFGVLLDGTRPQLQALVFHWPPRERALSLEHVTASVPAPLSALWTSVRGVAKSATRTYALTPPLSHPLTRASWTTTLPSRPRPPTAQDVFPEEVSYAALPEAELAALLTRALQFADAILQTQGVAVTARKASFPVYFIGGQPLRAVEPVQRARVLHTVRGTLTQSGYWFRPGFARALPGTEEAALGWAAVHALNVDAATQLRAEWLGLARAPTSREGAAQALVTDMDKPAVMLATIATAPPHYAGSLFLGPEHAFLAFEPDRAQPLSAHAYSLTFGAQPHRLYARALPRAGWRTAWTLTVTRVAAQEGVRATPDSKDAPEARNPCLPAGVRVRVRVPLLARARDTEASEAPATALMAATPAQSRLSDGGAWGWVWQVGGGDYEACAAAVRAVTQVTVGHEHAEEENTDVSSWLGNRHQPRGQGNQRWLGAVRLPGPWSVTSVEIGEAASDAEEAQLGLDAEVDDFEDVYGGSVGVYAEREGGRHKVDDAAGDIDLPRASDNTGGAETMVGARIRHSDAQSQSSPYPFSSFSTPAPADAASRDAAKGTNASSSAVVTDGALTTVVSDEAGALDQLDHDADREDWFQVGSARVREQRKFVDAARLAAVGRGERPQLFPAGVPPELASTIEARLAAAARSGTGSTVLAVGHGARTVAQLQPVRYVAHGVWAQVVPALGLGRSNATLRAVGAATAKVCHMSVGALTIALKTRSSRLDPRLLCFLGTYTHTLLSTLGVPANDTVLAFPSTSAEPALGAAAGAMLESVNALPWRLRPAEEEVSRIRDLLWWKYAAVHVLTLLAVAAIAALMVWLASAYDRSRRETVRVARERGIPVREALAASRGPLRALWEGMKEVLWRVRDGAVRCCEGAEDEEWVAEDVVPLASVVPEDEDGEGGTGVGRRKGKKKARIAAIRAQLMMQGYPPAQAEIMAKTEYRKEKQERERARARAARRGEDEEDEDDDVSHHHKTAAGSGKRHSISHVTEPASNGSTVFGGLLGGLLGSDEHTDSEDNVGVDRYAARHGVWAAKPKTPVPSCGAPHRPQIHSGNGYPKTPMPGSGLPMPPLPHAGNASPLVSGASRAQLSAGSTATSLRTFPGGVPTQPSAPFAQPMMQLAPRSTVGVPVSTQPPSAAMSMSALPALRPVARGNNSPALASRPLTTVSSNTPLFGKRVSLPHPAPLNPAPLNPTPLSLNTDALPLVHPSSRAVDRFEHMRPGTQPYRQGDMRGDSSDSDSQSDGPEWAVMSDSSTFGLGLSEESEGEYAERRGRSRGRLI